MKIKEIELRPLMPHQQNYVEWGFPLNETACLMEMRLGKTLSQIRLVVEWTKSLESGNYPCLIVAPSAVLAAWEYELGLEAERFTTIGGLPHRKRIELAASAFDDKVEGRYWILINYESLLYTPGLVRLPWFFVGLDESIIIKNPKSKISKLCTHDNSFTEVEKKAIMTGLISPEGELDIFQQKKFLHRSFLGCRNFYEYRNKFFYMDYDGWKPKGSYKKLIAEVVHNQSFILTRKQVNMGSKKIHEIRRVEMVPEQRKLYDSIEQDFVGELLNGDEKETDHVIVQRTWLARLAGGCDIEGNFRWPAKLKDIITVLKTDLKGEHVIIWCRFDAEIQALRVALKQAGIIVDTLTGADGRDGKKVKQEWFRKPSNLGMGKVIIVQEQKVAEYGVDMSVASTAIYYSVVYSCNSIAQTMDRLVHPRKTEALLYIWYMTSNSIDEDAIPLVKDKVTDAKGFMSRMKTAMLERVLSVYKK